MGVREEERIKEVREGGEEEGGEGKLISESNARRGEEKEVVEEEKEKKEVSFRGTSRVGNRLNFYHPFRHISLLHTPPAPVLFRVPSDLLVTRSSLGTV